MTIYMNFHLNDALMLVWLWLLDLARQQQKTVRKNLDANHIHFGKIVPNRMYV